MKRLILCMFLFFGSSSLQATQKLNYTIIYINGPSSCGKSTLIRALQDSLEESFLSIGIDNIIGLMPEKVNDWEGGDSDDGFCWKEVINDEGFVEQELQMGEYALKIHELYRGLVKTAAYQKFYFFIDDVAMGKSSVDRWRELLKDEKVLYVGLHAPLEVIEKRELERGDRMIGSARSFYNLVHKGVTYDLFLDTHSSTIEENVEAIKAKLIDSAESTHY